LKPRSIALVAGVCLFAGGILCGQALAKQAHMQAALQALNTAENQLQQATTDKGGHRKKALELVQLAKAEVKAGMAFDANH
jgi:hypothetical protein